MFVLLSLVLLNEKLQPHFEIKKVMKN